MSDYYSKAQFDEAPSDTKPLNKLCEEFEKTQKNFILVFVINDEQRNIAALRLRTVFYEYFSVCRVERYSSMVLIWNSITYTFSYSQERNIRIIFCSMMVIDSYTNQWTTNANTYRIFCVFLPVVSTCADLIEYIEQNQNR